MKMSEQLRADGTTTVGGSSRSDDGAVSVIVAVTISLILLGIAALVIDVGSLYQERGAVQTAVDAAALAGVQELPGSVTNATAKARAYVALNAPSATQIAVTFSSTHATNDTIKVVATDPTAQLFFARIWGTQSRPVAASAKACITSPVAYSEGVAPIGVVPVGGDETQGHAYGYGWGQASVIKEGGGSGTTGNYGWIDLGQGGGTGGLRDILISGGGPGTLGGLMSTVTGNRPSALSSLVDWIGTDAHTLADVCSAPDSNGVVHMIHPASDPAEGCHRLILVPILINPNGSGNGRYDWPSGKKDMKVIGFAQFFVTYAGGTGNNARVEGMFVRTVAVDELQGGAVGTSGQVHYALVQ